MTPASRMRPQAFNAAVVEYRLFVDGCFQADTEHPVVRTELQAVARNIGAEEFHFEERGTSTTLIVWMTAS
ncbi:MAG: hypothetical protein JWM97_1520 [Phycisphaerales bacterium]|nr:hypothetical protein [Phycisphaerales bacterium]